MRISLLLAAASAVFCVVGSLSLPTAEAHTKFHCTDLEIKNGQVVGCNGWPATDSRFVHIWGPNDPKDYQGRVNLLRGKDFSDQFLLEDILSRKKKMCTGTTPPDSLIAKVEAGSTVNVLWSTNNHGFPIRFYREPSRQVVAANAPEPDYAVWTNSTNLITELPFREPPSRCQKVDRVAWSPLKQIMVSNGNLIIHMSEDNLCWGPLQIPRDMPAGLNRILFHWHHPPNDAHFFDCMWVQIPPYRVDPEDKANSNVFDAQYYENRYPDLKPLNRAQLIEHWKTSGIKECRVAVSWFDARWYLEKYPDLKAAFNTNCEAALRHYLEFGLIEGRQGAAVVRPQV